MYPLSPKKSHYRIRIMLSCCFYGCSFDTSRYENHEPIISDEFHQELSALTFFALAASRFLGVRPEVELAQLDTIST